MKKFSVIDHKSSNRILTIIAYDLNIYKQLLKQLKKNKQFYIVEEE